MIHKTAIISSKAEICKDVSIGPHSIIEDDVIIDEGTTIGTGVVIKSNTKIGKNNRIFHYVIIGEEPQDKNFKNEKSFVEIGDSNIIREFTTIHRGCGEGEKTIIGSNNFIMCYAHFGHNVKVGSNTVLVNNTTLGGHSIVEDYAYLSAFVAVHQFTRVGMYAIVGGGYCVRNDVVPFAMAAGEPLRIVGINIIGLRRNNFSAERIDKIKDAFKIIFWSELNTKDAIEKLKKDNNDDINYLIEFIEKSKRGITRGEKNDR